MNYYYHCSKIREMMKLSKEENEEKLYTINNETIFVKYCKELDDFMLQYSWIITDKDINLQQEVKDILNEFQPSEYNEKIDVVQIGLITVYSNDEDDLSGLIGDSKIDSLIATNDTNYIFNGNKVLRIIQYYGLVRNPLENLINIVKWNEPGVQRKEMSKITLGIDYNYSVEDEAIIFSIGYKNKKTSFVESINMAAPQLIFIDNFLGVIEYTVLNKIK